MALQLQPAASRNASHGPRQDAYDRVYAAETKGFPALDLDRWPRNRWEALIRAFPPRADHVLEIGCGNGVVLHHVAGRCRRITGIEISENRCRVAEENLAGLDRPVEIIHADIERGIPMPDGSFDAIVWADVIEHVVDLFEAMREVSRLLAKDGVLITSTPNIAYLPRRLRFLFGSFPGTSATREGFDVRPGEMYDGGHLHYFTHSSLKKLYRRYGIRTIRTIGFGSIWSRFRNVWPSLLSGSVLLVGIKQ